MAIYYIYDHKEIKFIISREWICLETFEVKMRKYLDGKLVTLLNLLLFFLNVSSCIRKIIDYEIQPFGISVAILGT